MANIRVHQLAKELGISSKELISLLQEMGLEINNPLSSLDEMTAEQVRKEILREKRGTRGKAVVEEDKAGDKKAPGGAATKPAAEREARSKRVTEPEKGAVKAVPPKGPQPGAPRAVTPGPQDRVGEKPGISLGELPAPQRRAKPHAGAGEARKVRERPEAKPREERIAPPESARGPERAREAKTEEVATPRAQEASAAAPTRKRIRVPSGITARDFAQMVGKTPADIIKMLLELGEMVNINQPISDEALVLLGEELGFEVELKAKRLEEVPTITEDKPESLKPRPPVVTVMGHVDHGKTSLLDAIRKTSVTAQEVGGITQHIGASVVEFQGKTITFIDTPGHESFTALRARGAQVTDIAVLVVAADDGVMPQTIEAINHAKAADVPILVAVNKIDKPDANPTRVRQQLTEFNLVPEEWGGDTIFVDVSAKEGTNLDHLLEMILLLAEVHELKANPDAPASGNIIEAKLDRGRGPVATVIVKRGTLRRGDAVVAGKTYGKVRALIDDKGRQVKEAGPSTPVEIIGLDSVPMAGDDFFVVEDEKKAKAIVQTRLEKERLEESKRTTRTLSLEDLFQRLREGETQEFNLIIKGDTQGSVEAVRDSVQRIQVEGIDINIIHSGVGAVTVNDVTLAKASGAVIIGFNVRPEPKAAEAAEREQVEIRTYRVIYQLLEELEAALRGMLKPEFEEVRTGLLEVRATFRVPKVGVVAGAYVKEGEISRNSTVRLVRDGAIIYEGKVSSLKRFKDDVRSVSAGYECGVGLENFQDIKEGDLIEVIEVREVSREAPGISGTEE